MKKFLLAALLGIAAGGASVAWAEKADSYKETILNFDVADLDEVTQTRIFTGNFKLTRGTLLLTSDKATVKESPEGYMFVVLTVEPGKVATFRQKRDGGADSWVEGQAQRIEYDDRSGLVKLFASAKVKQLDSSRKTDEIDSEFIAYDSRKEVLTVRNDASGETKPGKGRGTMVIAPRVTAPPAAPAPAPAIPGKQQ